MATSEGQERELMEKIAGYIDRGQELKSQDKQLHDQKYEINDKIESYNREKQQQQQQQNQVISEIQKLEENLRNVSNSSGGRTALFGREMPDIVKVISKTQFLDIVYAPLGLSFKVKEEYLKNGWNHALEKGLGITVTAIVVTNSEDQKKMRNILESLNCASKFSIIRQNKSSKHNVRPINNQLTVLDALIVDNDPDNVIFNTLIDHIKAETKILIEEETSSEIAKYIEKDSSNRAIIKYGAKTLISKSATTIRYVQGNQAFERERNSMRGHLVSDMKDVIDNLKNDINTQKRKLDELRNNNDNNSEISSLHHSIKNITEQMKKIGFEIKKINNLKNDTNRKLVDTQDAGKIDTTELEAEVVELENTIVQLNDQEEIQISKMEDYETEIKDFQKLKKSIEREKNMIVSQIDENDAHVEEIYNRAKDRQSIINECKKKLTKAEVSFFDIDVEKQKIQDNYDKLKEKAEVKTRDLIVNWDGEPLKLSSRDSEKSLDLSAERLKKQLEEGRRKAGLEGRSREIIEKEYEIIYHDFKMAKKEYEDVAQLKEELDEDVDKRTKTWNRQLTTQTKLVARRFDKYLQKKGFAGKVDFNHNDRKLTLICQTDNLDENSKSSDVRQLSGGERSFTTLSLLLALGHVVSNFHIFIVYYDFY
jgi:chromosome segregation ATPase